MVDDEAPRPTRPGRARCVVGINDYEYTISLSIHSVSVEPERISAAFGLKPIRSHLKGEPRTTHGGKPRPGVWPSHYWEAEVPTLQGSAYSDSLAAFVSSLADRRDFVLDVTSQSQASIDLALFAHGLCDDLLPPDLLRRLCEYGIGLRIDYYKQGS